MELRHLRYFVTVAEHGHVTRAANALHIAQPAVSQALRQLERELGLVLFERSNRGMHLTDAGQRLLPDARAALTHARRVTDIASQTLLGRLGAVRVGYVPYVTDGLITRVMHLLRQSRPEIDVVMHEVGFLKCVQALRDRQVDLILATVPFDEPDLVRGPVVHRGTRVLGVPTGHPLQRRAPLDAEDLAGQTIAATDLPLTARWAEFWLPVSTPDGQPLRRGPVISTVGEMLTAVAAGQMVQLMPSDVARVYRREEITFLEIDIEGFEIVPVWRADGHTALIDAFVAALEEAGNGA